MIRFGLLFLAYAATGTLRRKVRYFHEGRVSIDRDDVVGTIWESDRGIIISTSRQWIRIDWNPPRGGITNYEGGA